MGVIVVKINERVTVGRQKSEEKKANYEKVVAIRLDNHKEIVKNKLRLNHCQIMVVPLPLFSMTHLVSLSLEHNQLCEFPLVLMNALPLLRKLNLSFNFIDRLPGEIFVHPALCQLNISYNRIEKPLDIPANTSLSINSVGNPISYSEKNQELSGMIKQYSKVLEKEVQKFPGAFRKGVPEKIEDFKVFLNRVTLNEKYSKETPLSDEGWRVRGLTFRTHNLLVEMVRDQSIAEGILLGVGVLKTREEIVDLANAGFEENQEEYEISEVTERLYALEQTYFFLTPHDEERLSQHSRQMFAFTLAMQKIDDLYNSMNTEFAEVKTPISHFRVKILPTLDALLQAYYETGKFSLLSPTNSDFYRTFAKGIYAEIMSEREKQEAESQKRQFATLLATAPCWQSFLSERYQIGALPKSEELEGQRANHNGLSSDDTQDEAIITFLMSKL